MRWLACCALLAGCHVRARATAVHPTDVEWTSTGKGSTIARVAPQTSPVPPAPDDGSANLASLELGGFVPFRLESARVHLAPGVRIFGSRSVLWGVALGADFLGDRRGPGFALEGSVHAGASSEPEVIQQALDLFAGITMHSKRSATSFAVGPSLGVLGTPGGHSVVTVGLGIRLTGGPRH